MTFAHFWDTLRPAADVKRWHTFPTLRQQTIGAHSYGVAMLCAHVAVNPSYNLIMAALSHDLPEIATGDVPAHVKWAAPEMADILHRMESEWLMANSLDFELTKEEEVVLRFCDSFELLLWCMEEVRLGNQNARRVVAKISDRIQLHPFPSAAAMKMFNDATEQYTLI